jgi:hypothetical protein
MKKGQPVKQPVFFGPTLPAELVAKEKIKKFEEDLADGIIREIEKGVPPDWQSEMPRALHTTPFPWRKTEALLPSWKKMSKGRSVAGASSMALIAGVYGDSDEETDEEAEAEKKTSKKSPAKRKLMQIQVKVPEKISKLQMKPVPSVFQSSADLSANEEEEEPVESSKAKTDKKDAPAVLRDKRGRKIYDSGIGERWDAL